MRQKGTDLLETDADGYGSPTKADQWMIRSLSLIGMILCFLTIRKALLSDATVVGDWVVWIGGAYLQLIFLTVMGMSLTGRLRIHPDHMNDETD